MKRLLLLFLGLLAWSCRMSAADAAVPAKTDSLVLGGGCFWCLDAAFQLLPGVTHVTCGYAGGQRANPSYEQVYTDVTGHVEVVKIDFDPAKISLEKVLEFFWQVGRSGIANRNIA